jgi:peptidoglycan/xylan/chitin deacetylase (PgdA/CDA1 family)
MRIYQTPSFVEWLWKRYLWKVSKNQQDKNLYLTFDDGPIPVLTEYVLDTLKEFRVKATFFCVGDNVHKHPDIFQRIIAEGHQIGNHTYNHLNGQKVKTEVYLENVSKCQEILLANGLKNEQPNSLPLFRPPYGRLNTKESNALLQQYKIVMWSVLTYDFDMSLRPEICYQKAVQSTQSGSVIVFHDNWKAEQNLRYTLPRYLAHFIRQGYEFKIL